MTRDDLLARMRRLDACDDATRWVESQNGSPYAMWRHCDRGDWLLWLAAAAGVDRRLVVLTACDCAETALVYVPEGEDRPRLAIETARAWARGEAPLEDVQRAADAAYAAAYAAPDAAHAAAHAAAHTAYADAAYAAAHAAAHTAYAAAEAANATYAAADAADAAAYDAADACRARSLAESARLVRRRIPWSVVRDALSGGES